MIWYLHGGHNPTLERLARRMADAIGDERELWGATDPLPPACDVTAVVAVWWPSVETWLPMLQANPKIRLVCSVYDHVTRSAYPCWGDVMRRANAVLASSALLKADLASSGIQSAVQADGVDCEIFRPGDRRPGASDRLIVGWAGDAAVGVKRLDLLRRGVTLAQQRGVPVDLILAERRNSPVAYDAMPAWYRGLDVIACVSECEGTPNPILEGCASGLPYLSTPVGLVPAIHASSSGGLILGANPSAGDIAFALRDLVARKAELAAMGERNRATCEASFRWDFSPARRALEIPSPLVRRQRTTRTGPRKILVLGDSLGLGGAEKLTAQIATTLHQQGHSVTLGLTSTLAGAFADSVPAGLPVVLLAGPEAIAEHADASLPDLIVANNCLAMKQAQESGLMRHVPDCIAYLLHGYVEWSLRLLPAVFAENNALLTMSEQCRDGILRQRQDIGSDRTHVIHTGIDTDLFCPGPTDRSILPWPDSKGPIFGTAGRYSREKDFEGMLHALAIIRQTLPDARLVSIGGCDPGMVAHVGYWRQWETRIRDTIDMLGLQDVVHLAGLVPSAVPYLRCFEVFWLSSMFEDLPLSMLEAMACEVPVVATAVGAIPGVLQAGGGVEVWKLGEAMDDIETNHFALASLDLVLDKHKARATGKAGRENILANRSLAAMATELAGFIHEVC